MTAEYATFEDLMSCDISDSAEDFTLSNGMKVRVRGLTRGEHLWAGKANDDPEEMEVRALSKGLIHPKLSREQVQRWQKSARSSLVREITDKISELTGQSEGADKSDL